MNQYYINIWNFLKNPDENLPSISKGKDKILPFLILLFFALAFVVTWSPVLNWIKEIKPDIFKTNKALQLFTHSKAPIFVAVYVIIIGPFIEELIFRLPLKLNKPGIYFSLIAMFLAIVNYSTVIIKSKLLLISLIFLAIILITFIYYFIRKSLNRYILSFWGSHYTYVFYTSAVLFGIIHIFNYKISVITLLLMPILVLPQFIMGTICGYIRIRMGFTWGYFYHAIYNAAFVLPILLLGIVPHGYKLEISEKRELKELKESMGIKGRNHQVISNDTIAINRLMLRDIIPNLLSVKNDCVEFTDQEYADKVLSIIFARKPERPSFSSKDFVLDKILKKYNLTREKIVISKEVYLLCISDTVRLNKFRQLNDKRPNYSVNRKDELILQNSGFRFTASQMSSAWKREVIDSTRNFHRYNLNIPIGDPEHMKRYLEEQFGLSLVKRIKNFPGYRISSNIKSGN